MRIVLLCFDFFLFYRSLTFMRKRRTGIEAVVRGKGLDLSLLVRAQRGSMLGGTAMSAFRVTAT